MFRVSVSSSLLEGYDETETLPYSIPQICSTSADVRHSAVVAHDPIYAEHRIDIISSYHLGIGASLVAEFNERFGGAEKEGYAKMALSPQRAFVSDMEAMGITSVEEHGALPAIQFGVEKFNLRHRAASCLNLQRVWTDIIAVQYDGDRGPITEEEKKIGSLFLDHFAKSVELGRSLGVLKSRFDSVFSALDRFHIGIFVLSPNGSVVVKNREAARLAYYPAPIHHRMELYCRKRD